jgi:hypothetical protein
MLWDRAVDFWLILSLNEHQIAFLGSKAKKAKKHPQTKPYIYRFWIPPKKWFPRLSLLK